MRRVITLLVPFMIASAAAGQSYVGDNACSGCHANFPEQGFFQAYRDSGHPYKLFHSAGEVPGDDTWPWTMPPPLPVAYGEQLEWSDVEYVIGNFFWKARFVDHDGYIYTGFADETTQWNIATEEFVPYHAGEEDKPYNCGRCHTTGYQPEGNQLGLPGLIGTWTEEGVRCEACHGPSSDHAANPSIPPPGGKACSECHYRDNDFRMPWKGGFMRHHQQSEEFSHSPHNEMLDCNSCHNPHRSVVYEDGGMTKHCTDCHGGDVSNSFYQVEYMEFLDCNDCHMPFIAKSAVAFNDYTGDVTGHLYRIGTEPIAAADNVYEVDGNLYWNQDDDGESFITLDYACLGCHLDFDDLDLEGAAEFAVNIHTAHKACLADLSGDGQVDGSDLGLLLGNWGNPGTGDINMDGMVDGSDLGVLLGAWGEC